MAADVDEKPYRDARHEFVHVDRAVGAAAGFELYFFAAAPDETGFPILLDKARSEQSQNSRAPIRISYNDDLFNFPLLNPRLGFADHSGHQAFPRIVQR